ncbi:hypothetical protein H0O01_05570 [Candidatus Micrarchaeota archaeon]|nr:hypothetical protein [Candidatus Micrarchaeota archaeon]
MKNKILAVVLGLVGAILVLASLYFAISYFSYLGKVIIEFFSANNMNNLASCGIVVPAAFTEIRDQFPTTLIPMLYLGIPLFLVAISFIMFGSGYFYGKHSMESEAEARRQREEHIQREVERRVGGKAQAPPSTKPMAQPEKPPAKPQEKPVSKPPLQQKK